MSHFGQLETWIMAHDSPALSQSKNFNPWPFSMLDPAAPDDTSGYDSRSRSNVTLAKAGPPDSWVNNTPFCHTSWQPEVPAAARTGTPPNRCQKRNQLAARSEHLWEARDCPSDRTNSCNHRSPVGARQWVTHCEKSHIPTNRDPTFADCTTTTPRWGTSPSQDGVEPPRSRLDSTVSPARRRRCPPPTVGSLPNVTLPTIRLKVSDFLLLTYLRFLWCDQEFYLCHPLFNFEYFFWWRV